MPADVQVLKVDVPGAATVQTPWQLTRLARQGYYEPVKPDRKSWSKPGPVGYREAAHLKGEDPDSDVYVLRKKRIVTVTPLTLDLTSRVELPDLEKRFRGQI